MKLAVVQGTRPEIVKNYSVVRALTRADVPFEVFHTGQHTRHDMCAGFYDDMGYQPTRAFPATYRLGAVVDWLMDCFLRERVTGVLVNGDTAAALAGALAGMYSDVPVAHVEAGLRSHDRFMLEERNRIMVDHIAHLLFAYTAHEVEVLRRSEGVRGRVHLLGNTTVDLIHDYADRIRPPADSTAYVLATLHRKELTDDPRRLATAFEALQRLARRGRRVVFPMHPRTADAVTRHGLPPRLLEHVEVVPPVGIFESLSLQRYADVVVTDSGCVQEEAYLLGTPCVTVRDNTERHLTVEHGANVLTGFDSASIIRATEAAAESAGRPRAASWPPIYGEPGAGDRMVATLLDGAGDEWSTTDEAVPA